MKTVQVHSEIFAGAVQDYEIGTIVGTTTYGKGIVQSIRQLSDGSAVKLTTAKYFTPKGNDIHKVGITPDVEVKLDNSLLNKTQISHEEDNQLQVAVKVVTEEGDRSGNGNSDRSGIVGGFSLTKLLCWIRMVKGFLQKGKKAGLFS